jgi:hypothetical protein
MVYVKSNRYGNRHCDPNRHYILEDPMNTLAQKYNFFCCNWYHSYIQSKIFESNLQFFLNFIVSTSSLAMIGLSSTKKM